MGWMQGSAVVKASPGHISSPLPSIPLLPPLEVVVLHPKFPGPKDGFFLGKMGNCVFSPSP